MMRRTLALLLLSAGCLVATSAPAWAATLSGRVVMGSGGAALPPDLKITVVEIAASGDMGSPQHVPAGPDGTYSFEGDPALSHLIGTIHSGVTYSMVAEPGELPARELKIFDTTTDVSAVEISSDMLTVVQGGSGGSDTLEILQLLRFRNRTDRTFTGETPGGVLKLPVPEGAFDLAPASESNNEGLTMTPQGLMTAVPLQPGEASFPYLYKVRVPRTGWQLRREVFYPTDQMDLLIGEGLRVDGAPGFEFQEKVSLGESTYNRYRAAPLLPGAVVASDIGFRASTGESGAWYGAGAILVAVTFALAAGILTLRRRRGLKEAAAAPATDAEIAASPSRQELIDRVALLDESFDAGGLGRSEYETERSKLLAQLKAARAATP